MCKPIDTYLHKASCHPWATKMAITYSQALRLRRMYSEDCENFTRLGDLAG